jgi:hypothetical protein
MLQVQHPSVPDHTGAAPLTELFASSALFSIRPCSRAEATSWAESRWVTGKHEHSIAELESAVDAYIYEDEDDF